MRKLLCLLVITLGLGTAAYAQEICANGIDDDLDGFIDCFDNECAKNSICTGGYVGNDLTCEAKPSEFPKFSLALESASPNGSAVHLGRVVVGDIDRDGFPEMLTINTYTKKILILNGENTGGINTIQKQLTVSYNPAWEDILIGNLNNDNCAEIFVISTSWKLYAYDCNLVQLWATQLPGDPGMMGLADFNADGKVELYARNAILNAHTGAFIVAPAVPKDANGKDDWTLIHGGPVAVDILSDASKNAHLLTDAIKDDKLELVSGGTIYSVNIAGASITSEKTIPNYSKKVAGDATSIADFNNDGSLDVIASGRNKTNGYTTIFFWDVKTDVIKTYADPIPGNFTVKACPPKTGAYYKNGWDQGTGRVNIADIDGDGKLNAAYVSGKFLYALKEDLTLLWKTTVNEETSGNTGCTLFDFNGDGKSEIVYRDEKYIYIINGTDGTIFTQQACVSRTNREYPVVADVDADGNTELCVTCRTVDFIQNGTITDPMDPNYAIKDDANFCDLTNAQNSQVRVFKSGAEPWVPARRVWNQHGYFNVNVHDNLSIPKIQQKHHIVFSSNVCTNGANRPLNSFLNQSPFLNSLGCPKYASPDLAYIPNSLVVNPPTCPDGNFTVSFKITNQGDLTLSGNVPITFYNGNPTQPDAVKLNTVNVNLSSFKVSEIKNIDDATVNGPGTAFTLYIVLNDAGTTVPTPIKLPNTNFVECDYSNNILSAAVSPLPVAITAVKVQDNVKCSPGSTADNGAIRAYVMKGAVENTTDYNFYWSIGNVAKPIASADFTGAIWTGRPAGTYTVYGIHKTANCSSDTTKVVVDIVSRSLDADVLLVHAYDQCTPPNGSIRVIINDEDGNGVGENPDLFSYTWYEGNDIFTAPLIGINDTLKELGPLSYTVLVKDKVTGCQIIASFTVPDQTVVPVVTAVATEVTCANPTSGSVSASVNGFTSGYTFKWFLGETVKPVADFIGAVYPDRPVGKYTVQAILNSSSCNSAPQTIEVLQIASPVVIATLISDQTSCDQSQPTGSASAVVNGTTTGYNFEWFKGQNTLISNKVSAASTATGLTNAIYTVKATSVETGCSDIDEVVVNFAIVTPTLAIASTVNPTTCITPNGSITMSVSVDTPSDYTFYWYKGESVKVSPDFGYTNETLSGLEDGTFTVSAVNNRRHCETAALTMTLTNAAPNIAFSLTNIIRPSTCNDSNGSLTIDVSATGNTQGFDYEWRTGQAPFLFPALTNATHTSNTTTINGLTTGVYTLVATDRETGCHSSQYFNLPFDDAQILSLVSKADITNCVPGTNGSIRINLTKTTGFQESDYRIDIFQGTNDLGPTGTVLQSMNGVDGTMDYTLGSPLQPGNYTFVAVTTNPARSTFNCRSVPVTVELILDTQNPELAVTQVINNMNCNGAAGNGEISVSVSSPTNNLADYNFVWHEGGDASTPLLGTSTSGIQTGISGEAATSLTAGKYTVVVTKNAGASSGCQATASFQVFDNLPILTLASGDIILQDIERCDMMSGGSIKVNVVNENGLQNPASNYTFSWFSDSPSGPQLIVGATTNILSNQPSGRYFVLPTNNATNCSTAEPTEANILDKTKNTVSVGLASFVIPTQCLKPVNIGGQFNVMAAGTSTNGYTYQWYTGQSTSAPLLQASNVSGTNGEIAQNLISGYYTIDVTNNTTQCKVTDTYELPVDKRNVTITTSAEPLTVCYDATKDGAVFAAVTSGNKNDYVYNWYQETVKATPDFTSTPNTPVPNLSSGKYIVVAIDNIDSNCITSDTIQVNDQRIMPIASALSLSPVTVCDPARPDGAASVSVNGDFINYTFDWYDTLPPAGQSFYVGAQAGNLDASTFAIIATSLVTGCSDTTQVSIEMSKSTVPVPVIEILSLVTSCVEGNGSLTASVNGNTSDYIFNWYAGSQHKAAPDFTGEYFDNLNIGTYAVTATSRITGCISPLVTEVVVDSLVYPQFNFTTVAAVCKRDAVDESTGLAAVFVTNGIDIGSITWEANGATITGPILSGVDAGIYPVTVATTLGCSLTKELEIKTEIHPFNGISRNQDGQNDLFFINCIESFPSNTVKIFNRAGTLVYEAEGYDNNAIFFDGKSNKGISLMGNNLPGGTYFYIIDKHDGTKPLAGYLELIN